MVVIVLDAKKHTRARLIWIKPIVVKGIKVLKKHRVKLNSTSIQTNNSPEGINILSQELGFSTSPRKLFAGALGRYGSWDLALKRAGVGPAKIKKHEAYWTKELVLTVIQKLYSSGVPLHSNGISKDNSERTKLLLKEVTGRDLRGLKIFSAGSRLFGGWHIALQEAGINPDFIRRDDEFWSRELILKALKALFKAQIPVHSYRLARDRTDKTRKILEQNIHISVTGAALYTATYKEFGSIYKALNIAGIRASRVRTDTRFWTKKDISKAIRALHKSKIPLAVVKVERDRSSETTAIIYRAMKLAMG